MTDEEIISRFDHTLLKPDMTAKGVDKLCDEAVSYGAASVCVPPCFVRRAKKRLDGSPVVVCTVVGFPHGYSTRETKVFETSNAIEMGADEIDMVINVAMLKSGDVNYVESEIKEVRAACAGKTLKVIVETGALTDCEKRMMCDVAAAAGADYIKTSTGFNFGGATKADVSLLVSGTHGKLKVKASGGIRSLTDAQEFIELGADRIGESGAM